MKINPRKRSLVFFLFVLSGVTLKPSLASCLPRNDFQIWGNLTAIGSLTENTRYWIEGQARFGDDASRLSQKLLRPGIGYILSDTSTIWFGYAYINTQFPFTQRNVDENRLWQQYLWAQDFNWGRAFIRTRLEQRFIGPVPTTGWRFRQFARIQHIIDNKRKVFISAAEEIFIQINNTFQEGSNRGFDQNRIFVGFGCLPTSNFLIEVGYQNQYIRRINDRDYAGNYIATNFVFSF